MANPVFNLRQSTPPNFISRPKEALIAVPSAVTVDVQSESINARSIPQSILEFFKDEQWMAFIVELFGIASEALELVGNIAGEVVPFVTIASSPFYVGHAVKSSKESLEMTREAAHTHQVGESFFWFGKAADSVGTAIGEMAKPFSGGFDLAGLTGRHVALGVTFTTIIPIILMVCGTIGTIGEGVATVRANNELNAFNERIKSDDLKDILRYIQGHEAASILERKLFEENHFSSDERKEFLVNKAKEILQKMEKLDQLYKALYLPEDPVFEEAFRNNREALNAAAKEIIHMSQAEIHRVMSYHVVLLSIAILLLISGTLLLIPHHHEIGVILALSSGGLTITQIIFDKSVSQQSFYTLDQHIQKFLEKKSDESIK